jgi:hypothetical protein
MDMGVDIARVVEATTGVDALSEERLTQVRV